LKPFIARGSLVFLTYDRPGVKWLKIQNTL
jgi:hypothetical protein